MEVSVNVMTNCSRETALFSSVSRYHQNGSGSVSRRHTGMQSSSSSENKAILNVCVPSPVKYEKTPRCHNFSSDRKCSTSARSVILHCRTSKGSKSSATSGMYLTQAAHGYNDENEGGRRTVRQGLSPVSANLPQGKNRRKKSLRQKTVVASSTFVPTRETYVDEADFQKAGGVLMDLVQFQAKKPMEQPKIADKLQGLSDIVHDLVVIGCGPAGLSLAAEAAKQGLNVGLVGPDLPFTNNYGVWEDEFAALGLENCIEQTWKDSAMYFESDTPLLIGRAYGRVDRHLLHEELLKRCAEAGVQYLDAEVERISDANDGSTVMCANAAVINCRLVTVASGAAAGRFLQYEPGGPGITVQTAYGMEVEVENFTYNPEVMLFMDYRDYKAWGTENCPDSEDFKEVPSFLYAMPVSSTRVFFEETCLAARPTMSFNLLKERLLIRLEKMGVKVVHMYEEEFSYIPVGATLPDTTQQHLGFGAAASMIHPATGYSVVRSLSEAPSYAAAIAAALRSGGRSARCSLQWQHSRDVALQAWNALWPLERKRQRAFFIFGLELILQLDLAGIREFFSTFFDLPEWLWKGFLAAKLSSLDLIWFALITFVVAPNTLRFRLVRHLMSDPSGTYLWRTYMGLRGPPEATPPLLPVEKTQADRKLLSK